jgi:hypothetical protein
MGITSPVKTSCGKTLCVMISHGAIRQNKLRGLRSAVFTVFECGRGTVIMCVICLTTSQDAEISPKCDNIPSTGRGAVAIRKYHGKKERKVGWNGEKKDVYLSSIHSTVSPMIKCVCV